MRFGIKWLDTCFYCYQRQCGILAFINSENLNNNKNQIQKSGFQYQVGNRIIGQILNENEFKKKYKYLPN